MGTKRLEFPFTEFAHKSIWCIYLDSECVPNSSFNCGGIVGQFFSFYMCTFFCTENFTHFTYFCNLWWFQCGQWTWSQFFFGSNESILRFMFLFSAKLANDREHTLSCCISFHWRRGKKSENLKTAKLLVCQSTSFLPCKVSIKHGMEANKQTNRRLAIS